MSTIKKNLAIGIDIGGTNTCFGIIDTDGHVLERGSIKTKNHPQVESFIDDLYLSAFPLIERAGGSGSIVGIGIGAPNGNYYNGTIEHAPNLAWKGIIPFAKLIGDKFSLPAYLTNDANAAAMGEMKYGAARNMKDFIMLTLGTGVGSGIVCNGKLVYGHDGFAGEWAIILSFREVAITQEQELMARWKCTPVPPVLRSPQKNYWLKKQMNLACLEIIQ